jgi:osmoprotectant transport system permease protein
MSLIGEALSWLGTASTWTGDSGLLHLAVAQLRVTAEALGLAMVVGIPLGLLLGHRHRGGTLVTVLGNLGRAIPTLGLLILLTQVGSLGVSERTAVLALALFGLPPVLSNAYTGTADVDRDTVDAAKGLGLRPRQVITKVELPLALPLIAAGIRTAAVQIFATATLASYVGTPTLGTPIQVGQSLQEYDQVLGAAIVIAVMALLIDLLLGRIQMLMTPGAKHARLHVPSAFPGGATAVRVD